MFYKPKNFFNLIHTRLHKVHAEEKNCQQPLKLKIVPVDVSRGYLFANSAAHDWSLIQVLWALCYYRFVFDVLDAFGLESSIHCFCTGLIEVSYRMTSVCLLRSKVGTTSRIQCVGYGLYFNQLTYAFSIAAFSPPPIFFHVADCSIQVFQSISSHMERSRYVYRMQCSGILTHYGARQTTQVKPNATCAPSYGIILE